MSSLTTSFPLLSEIKTSLLLVEVTPFDILVSVLNPSEPMLSYDSVSPLPFQSLEDLVENFFERHNFEHQPDTAFIALPLSFMESPQKPSLSSPPFSWTFDQEKFKNRFNLQKVFLCDRGTAIAKSIPLLGPSDIRLFSSEHSGYFSEPQNVCFSANIDCGFEEVSLIPIREKSLKTWKPLKNLGGSLRLETDLPYVQHVIDMMKQDNIPPFPLVSDFVKNTGIESIYRTLYKEKGTEASLRRKLVEAPRIIDPGAPIEIDPREINNPPRMSIEGMDISIASIEPRHIKKEKPNPLMNPISAPNPGKVLEEEIDWNLIRSLTIFQILKGAFDFCSLKSSIFAQSPSVLNLSLPNEVQKLCFETLDMWSLLLGKIIGRHTLILNARGGAYLSGRLLYLLKDLFEHLSFTKSFEKESMTHPAFQNTPFFLITHVTPAFLGMVQLFLEQDRV